MGGSVGLVQLLKRLYSVRSPGQTLVIFGLALIPILSVVGVGVDMGHLYAVFRFARNAADAGAMAGARAMATGTAPDRNAVRAAIDTAVKANHPLATVLKAELVFGNGPDAQDCMTSNPVFKDLDTATTTDLLTADCLRVRVRIVKDSYFLQVVGFATFNADAAGVAAAQPVTAMGGLVPIAAYDGQVALGNSITWGEGGAPSQRWGQQVLDSMGPGGTPWVRPDVNPINPNLLVSPPFTALSGLVRFVPCRYTVDGTPRGFDNPSTAKGALPTAVWQSEYDMGPEAYSRGWHGGSCNQSRINESLRYYAEYGFDGWITVGDEGTLGTVGRGDFFSLETETSPSPWGQFVNGFKDYCEEATGNTGGALMVPIAVFNFLADPNFDGQISAHLKKFAMVQFNMPSNCAVGNSVTGTVTNGTVPPSQVLQVGGKRSSGTSNVTVIRLVADL